jgi:TP901 family phage tail tape measure protein
MARTTDRAFDRMDRRIKRFNTSLTRMGTKMRSINSAATVAFASVGFVVGAAVNDLANFERALGKAAAKFPEDIKRGTAAFEELRIAAREVGATTEFTAQQAADGLDFFAKAGKTAKFSMDALRPTVDFATAASLDFATAADIATDAVGAMGLEASTPAQEMENLTRVMDVFTAASTGANLTVEQLFESFVKAAPLAKTTGASLETTVAILATLANAGIKASVAGTGLKNIFLALAGASEGSGAGFKKLGIELADVEGNLRDPLKVIDDLRKKLVGKGSEARVNIIESIFGKIPLASVNVLLNSTNAQLEQMRRTVTDVRGSTGRMAEAIRSDLKGSIDSFSSAVLDLKLGVLGLQKSPLGAAIDSWTNSIRNFTAAVEDNPLASREIMSGIVDSLKGLVTILVIMNAKWLFMAFVVPLATKAWVAFTFTMGLLKGAFIALRAPMLAFAILTGGVTAPLILIGGAIAALIGLGVALVLNWDSVVAKAREVGNAITSIPLLGSLVSGLGSGLGGIGDIVSGLFNFGDERQKAVQNVDSPLISGIVRETTSNVNLTIHDKAGAATLDIPSAIPGVGITFSSSSGDF